MADDPERDIFPTKEGKGLSSSIDMNPLDKHLSPEKRFSLHLSKTDLEDQFYKFKEENFQLKKAAKKQEDELKRLATKMTRLLREKKSMELIHSPGHKRDLELEEMVEDLQDKVRHLEKTNTQLREKALVAKQQVIMQARRPNPYSHVPPKVNSGNLKSGSSPYVSSINLRAKNLSRKPVSTPIPPYALSLLEEARTELSNLKMLATNQRNEIEIYQQENELLKQNIRMREMEFEEELNILKSQLTQRQRQHVQENLDLIRLHRELKQKNSKMLGIQAQYSDMEEKMRILKLNHDHLVKDMDELALRFKNEQKKNLELLGELQKAEITYSASSELQERVKSLLKENDVLRETNDTLIKSAFVVEKERSFNQLEQVLKNKISNLEISLELQMKAKNSLEEEFIKEKSSSTSKDVAYNLLKDNFSQMKIRMEELEMKSKFLRSESVDFDDLQEALKLLKLHKEGKFECINKSTEELKKPNLNSPAEETKEDATEISENTNDINSKPMIVETENIIPVPVSEEIENLKSRLKECEDDHQETLQELNNVREMLMTQCNLNNVAQGKMKLLTEKIDEQQRAYQSQLEEYSHLLDIRATRIQKLEKQLNDIAYGTTTLNLSEPDSVCENLKPVTLSRGENIFEIHISKVIFSSDGLEKLSCPNSKVFLTWNFYEFELQSTPVVSAEKPFFNFTAQYTVEVDDYFLCYLHENAVSLELHESIGVDYKTIAECNLNFSNIFHKSKGKIHGTQKLTGSNKGESVEFGTVEYWVQLKIPMEDAFNFFQEKIKALKYIRINKGTSTAAVDFLKQPSKKDSCVNELHIKILRGINLKSRQKGVQLSTFCVYKFYDLPDQDTVIIPASNNPEFSDHHIFSLYVDPGLEKYLTTENLYIYVFDDSEPDISNHIGRASVPLQPLVKNKPVKGVFELLKDEKFGNGSIEVLIYWQYDYCPVSDFSLLNKEKFQYGVSEASPLQSSSDDEVTMDPVPTLDYSISTPPVPKPRTCIPTKKITSTPVAKTSDVSSSDGDNTYKLSPQLSPVHSKDQGQANAPQPAKRTIRPSEDPKDTPLLTKVKKSQLKHEDEWSDVMSDTERRASFEETSDQEKQDFYDDDSDESDSEDYSPSRQQRAVEQVPTIVIQVSYLQLRADAAVLQDSSINQLYVEYRFLDYPLEELETPFSLPKKGPPDKIEFDFVKEFPLKLKDLEKWNLLSVMLTSDSPESSLIKFTVVSEPTSDEQNVDCEDVGYGSVDLREILKTNKDKIQEEIKILDARDNATVIGSLNISIHALDVLLLLQTFAEL